MVDLNNVQRAFVVATLILLAQLTIISSARATNPVGVNLQSLSYFDTELPFLNIVKKCGGNSSTVSWVTATSIRGSDTSEQLSLNLDSDGYPLTIPQSGLTSTMVYCLVFRSPTGSLAPGQTSFYPPGSYTVQFSGAGTIAISGDASATITTSGSTFTVSTPTANGIYIGISASAAGNHIRNLSVVQTSLVPSYNAGAIFHPTFLATVQNYKSFRFMDWRRTNAQFPNISYSGTVSAGATSLTMTSAWNFPSGTYTIYFQANNDGAPQSEYRAATFTAGSTSVTWSGALANSYTLGYTPVDVSYSWANRALPSNVSYIQQDGVPVEIMVALCNAVGANCWFNFPLTASDSYIQDLAALVINGTGAQSGYSALNSGLSFYAELGNEVWNTAFTQYGVSGTLGYKTFQPKSGADQAEYAANWYGMRVAQMASDLQAQLGSAFSRCIPVINTQAASTGNATYVLSAPFWTSGTGPPSTYPIKGIAIAPYWGGNPSTTDATTMTGVATPLDDFFATLTGQTGTAANGSHTYSSVPTAGYLGQSESWISSYAALMSSYPSMHLVAYEGGQSFMSTSTGTASGWPALVNSAERDARMGTAYTNFLNYWKATVGSTNANIMNLYNDSYPLSQYGAWGALEHVMQTITPLSNAPAKFQGIQNYICSGSACPTTNIPMPPTNLVVH